MDKLMMSSTYALLVPESWVPNDAYAETEANIVKQRYSAIKLL